MPQVPNWTPEQHAEARRVQAAKLEALRESERIAREKELAAQEAIRDEMERRFGKGVQFIACRRGKPPVFGRPR